VNTCLTRFFGTLLDINIAVGVVTGLMQEFRLVPGHLGGDHGLV
jgi:cytochrome bd-type quinol oxidase subunit 1